MELQQLLGPNGLIYAVNGENNEVHILWGGRLYYSFHRDNTLEKNLGVVILARLGVAQRTISEFFDVERHTVHNLLSVYDTDGLEGLREYKAGRPGVAAELRRFVIQKYIELSGRWGYQTMILEAVKEKVQQGLFSATISRGELQKLIREHKRQVSLQREEEQQRQQAAEQRKKEKLQREEARVEQEEVDSAQLELQPAQRVSVQHGGAAAVIPLLSEFGLRGLLPAGSTVEDRRYSIGELAVSYCALNAARLVAVEQDFKLLDSYQIGGLIGRRRLPSLSLYRDRIAQIVPEMDMPQVMLRAAVHAKGVFGTTQVAYIDGHFMPYYGEVSTLYGYNPQRRLAMPGREYISVHDEAGMPIFAALSDEYRKFQYYLQQIDERLCTIYGVGPKQILEVFDRGGYSKEFCINIAGHIRFICWRSDARTVPAIEAAEWKEVLVELHPNEYEQKEHKCFEAWERQRVLDADGRQGKFREIWIKSGKKVSPALSNDFGRSLQELVAALVRRWGAQENGFKEMKAHGIDRIHSYRKEPWSAEHLYARGLEEPTEGVRHQIDNPKIRTLNRELRRLRQRRDRLARSISTAKEGGNKAQYLRQLKQKAAQLNRRMAKLLRKRQALPVKVLLMKRIKEEQIVRLCDSKKLFFDWLKMNAIWARKVIVDVVKPYYKDLRDVNKFVSWLLRTHTTVTRQDSTLVVEFARHRSQNIRTALKALCVYLNDKPPVDLGLSFTKMHFRINDEY